MLASEASRLIAREIYGVCWTPFPKFKFFTKKSDVILISYPLRFKIDKKIILDPTKKISGYVLGGEFNTNPQSVSQSEQFCNK